MLAPVRIFLAVLVILIGAAAGVWFYLFSTPPGRASLKKLAEAEIASVVGGHAKIGALKGDLPGEILLDNIVFTDLDGEWLTIDRAELNWRPLSLLRGKVEIDRAMIVGARLNKAPPDNSDDDEKPRGFELPDRLPNISVGEVNITDFNVAESLTGRTARLDGAGFVKMGGRVLDISLSARSSGERDFFSARIEREGDALSTEILVKSDEDGVIAALSGLSGPVFIDAKGDGPLSGYRLDFTSTLGAFGSLDGALSGDLERMESIAFKAKASLGARLSNTAKIVGSKAILEGAFSPLENGGELSLSNFRSALGEVKGTARWNNRNKLLHDVSVSASALLDEAWRPDIRPYIGDDISVVGEVRQNDGKFIADARVTAAYFDGVLKGFETDFRAFARGPADVTLRSNPALPEILSAGADVSGNFNFRFSGSIAADPFRLTTVQDATFNGAATYDFDTRAFSAKGDASLPPELILSIDTKLAAKRHAAGAINIRGTPEKFSGTIVATLPPILYEKSPFPASRTSLAFANAPATTSGQISVRASDDSRRLNANFARSASGALRLEGVDYVGSDFALKGSATLLEDQRGAVVDLSYRGAGAAEPWPGFPLAGDFTAKGSIARGGAMNNLTLTASALASPKWSVEDLSATAEGPAARLNVKGAAGLLAIDGAAPIKNISTEMTARLEQALHVNLAKLTADIAGAPLRLAQPSQITIGDGVSIEKFRASVGRQGSIALDGGFSKQRWRALVTIRRTPIVSAASMVDLDLDLDTDRQVAARGSFTMSSLLAKEENASLSGLIVWDGRTVVMSDDGKTEALKFKFSLPARLQRARVLGVSTDGPLTGSAQYEGRVETIAGFLPAAMQSIEGALRFSGEASGTLKEPRLHGDLSIADGAFTELSSGLSVVNINAEARADAQFSGTRIDFKASGSGVRQKDKTIAANGTITIGKEARLASRTILSGAKLSAGPITEAEATGEIDLSGPFDQLLAKGDLTVRSLDARVFTPETTGLVDINVVRLNGDGRTASTGRTMLKALIAYAINIKGDDRIFVRGRGLESEWRADARIEGRADAPVILGSMTMRNGEITFAGRRFEMTKGEIAFDRLSVNNPSLNLSAERETKSGTLASIVIEGRARAPKISLTSTPSLPAEDIMALILFDKPASELSAIESLQVAEGLAELGGIGPFGGNGITGSARQALGLDLLNVDIDEADSAASSLTVGKYVADGLFVSATQDARGENGSVRIEYEIDQKFTVETELRQDGDQTVSVNWKRDF